MKKIQVCTGNSCANCPQNATEITAALQVLQSCEGIQVETKNCVAQCINNGPQARVFYTDGTNEGVPLDEVASVKK